MMRPALMAAATHLDWKSGLMLRAQVALWRYGWIWCISAAALIAAVAVWLTETKQAQAQLAQMRTALAATAHGPRALAVRPERSSDEQAQRLAQVLSVLQGSDATTDQISQILDAAARHGIDLPKGEYRTSVDRSTLVTRTLVSLPVKAGYPQLRSFVEDVLRSTPNASVDQISFRREAAAQASVEATLRISLWSKPMPGAASAATRESTGSGR